MISVIGIMAGAYIFSRMITAAMVERPADSRSTTFIIRLLSIATALFTLCCMIYLLIQGGGILPDALR